MTGKHDRAGHEPDGSGFLPTGPIVIRGLARGVKDVLRPNRFSRHRALEGPSQDIGLDPVLGPHETGIGSPQARSAPSEPVPAAVVDEHEEHDVARRRRGKSEDADAAVSDAPPDAAERGEMPEAADAGGGESDTAPAGDAPRSGSKEDDDGGAVEQLFGPGAAVAVAATRARTASPFRQRFRRESAGIVVLVVLAVVCAGLIVAVVQKTRADAVAAAREAAGYTPAALSQTAAPAGAVVAVVGDESALTGASGLAERARWPQLLGEELDAQVVVLAGSGAGYAAEGASASTFGELAAKVPKNAATVVFVGGAADDEVASLSLARAATEAFSAASERAPDAKVVAIGPLFRPSGAATDDFVALRQTLRSAARIAGVRWVDPVTARWLTGVDAVGDLDDADQRTIVTEVEGVLDED